MIMRAVGWVLVKEAEALIEVLDLWHRAYERHTNGRLP